MVESILQNTPKRHKDFSNCSTACSRLKELAQKINQQKKWRENFIAREKVVGQHIKNFKHEDRILIDEGVFTDLKGKQVYLLLCNDVLFYSQTPSGGFHFLKSSSSAASEHPSEEKLISIKEWGRFPIDLKTDLLLSSSSQKTTSIWRLPTELKLQFGIVDLNFYLTQVFFFSQKKNERIFAYRQQIQLKSKPVKLPLFSFEQ